MFGPREERHERLDLGGGSGVEISEALPNGQRLLIRKKPGVLVFDKVPLDALVNVRMERASSLQQSDGVQASPALAGYRFELSPRPAQRTFDLTAHFNVAGGGPPYSISAGTPSGGVGGGHTVGGLRTLHNTPGTPGRLIQRIDVPAYAAFAPAQEGELVNMGKLQHQLPMPGRSTGTAFDEQDRNILRLRYQAESANRSVGDDVTPSLGGPPVTRIAQAVWGNTATDGLFSSLVPGSIVMTMPLGTETVLDDGFGHLVGSEGGLGVVDYVSGAFAYVPAVAQTGVVTANFGHSIDYAPINAFLEWDALVPQ